MTEKVLTKPETFPEEMSPAFFQEHLRFIANGNDTKGIEIMAMTKMVANMMEVCFSQSDPSSELSPARWGLLTYLLEEESKGNCEGITPTSLSQSRNVRKNTISSILRGLEDQGLIERNLDAEDRRIFRIRLTDKGRQMVEKTSPLRVNMLNKLVSGLEFQERQYLVNLLDKLIHSVATNGNLPHFVPPIE
jgi:DNA-binding MarR family transcriptional regulator